MLRTLFRPRATTVAAPMNNDAPADAPLQADDEWILVERRAMLVMDPETAEAYVAAMSA